MPRSPRFRTASVEQLHRELQYAPRETLLRQMNAAETLIGDLESTGTYPEEFIVWRITGYRPEGAESAPATVVGAALIADLVTFVQRVSAFVGLADDDVDRDALSLEDVADRLNVSLKTVQRYRARGLVCHQLQTPDAPDRRRARRLVCFVDALERFRSREGDRLDRAAAFARMDPSAADAIILAAADLAVEGRSLNETATDLAARHGWAHETVRHLLVRHDRRAAEPIFREHGPLTRRDGVMIRRAVARGVDPGTIARRLGKSTQTVRRSLQGARARQLQKRSIGWVELPTLDFPDAEEVILSAEPVRTRLDALPDFTDAMAVIRSAHEHDDVDEEVTAALAGAANLLRRRAALRLAAAPSAPSRGVLDTIEMDLRWASRLKRRLIGLGLPVAVGRIDQYLHRPLEDARTTEIIALLHHAIIVCARVADDFDPGAGQRIARRIAYDMDRALAGLPDGSADARAAVRHDTAVAMVEALDEVNWWDHTLDLPRSLRRHLPALAPDTRAVAVAHWGLEGPPPRTAAAIAETTQRTPASIRRTIDRAWRELVACRRG